MSSIELWLVRHKPTGGYLPEPVGRMGRGGSHVEPTDPAELPPRLFRSKIAAQRALSAWLRGKFIHASGYDSFTGEYWEETDVVAVPSRVKTDMEVVNVQALLP